MNVLIILGHPRHDSLCGALATAYEAGVRRAGLNVECIRLSELDFDLDVHSQSPNAQHQEVDLLHARELLSWADHWVFVFPNWWGAMPARLKGFLDRALTPGFAFLEREEGGYEGLLHGKSAHLLVTMDTPPWVYRWLIKQPGIQSVQKATLEFCGVAPVRVSLFGVVKEATSQQCGLWLEKAEQEGFRLGRDVPAGIELWKMKALAWLRAIRLQFYPMAWVAYTVGALAAAQETGLHLASYWTGYVLLFLLEMATVFLNDYHDFETDRRNRNYSAFSGGSRVLVERQLSFRELRFGVAGVLTLCCCCAVALLLVSPASASILVQLLMVAAAITLGYTAPPLKLAYKVSAELDVCLTHSFLLIVCGWIFQGGHWAAPLPWLVGLPLFFAGFPSITLAAVPDQEADALVGKATFATRMGTRAAMNIAMLGTLVSSVLAVAWQIFGIGGGIFSGAAYWIVPHALLIFWLIQRHLRSGKTQGRINALMMATLTYMLPFGVFPLWHLWQNH